MGLPLCKSPVMIGSLQVSGLLSSVAENVTNTIAYTWAALFHSQTPGGAPAGAPAHHGDDPRGPAAAAASTAAPAPARML
ncbi:hypothetical protein ABPG77_003404 [Micractinium sp. CCAP 211/92]